MNQKIKKAFIEFQKIYASSLIVIILIALILVLIMGVLVINELAGARNFCLEVNGTYTFKISEYPIPHYCNEKPLFQYKNGWNFDIYNKTINLDDLELN